MATFRRVSAEQSHFSETSPKSGWKIFKKLPKFIFGRRPLTVDRCPKSVFSGPKTPQLPFGADLRTFRQIGGDRNFWIFGKFCGVRGKLTYARLPLTRPKSQISKVTFSRSGIPNCPPGPNMCPKRQLRHPKRRRRRDSRVTEGSEIGLKRPLFDAAVSPEPSFQRAI